MLKIINHRFRVSGLVGAVIAWLLLFVCEFICAQTLPNDEPDAYKPSASTDPKKITISDERVLPEISLGGMEAKCGKEELYKSEWSG